MLSRKVSSKTLVPFPMVRASSENGGFTSECQRVIAIDYCSYLLFGSQAIIHSQLGTMVINPSIQFTNTVNPSRTHQETHSLSLIKHQIQFLVLDGWGETVVESVVIFYQLNQWFILGNSGGNTHDWENHHEFHLWGLSFHQVTKGKHLPSSTVRYGWHFPEMGKIVTENLAYAKVWKGARVQAGRCRCRLSLSVVVR